MSIKTIKARIQEMICDARYAIKSTWAKTRLARLPDFKHDGLQTTFFFGSYPDPDAPLKDTLFISAPKPNRLALIPPPTVS